MGRGCLSKSLRVHLLGSVFLNFLSNHFRRVQEITLIESPLVSRNRIWVEARVMLSSYHLLPGQSLFWFPSLSVALPCFEHFIIEITQCVSFYIWLFLPTLCLWDSFESCFASLLILNTQYYSILWRCHNLSVHFNIGGFQSCPLSSGSARNILVCDLVDLCVHFCWVQTKEGNFWVIEWVCI